MRTILVLLLASSTAFADSGDKWNGGTVALQAAAGAGGMALGAVGVGSLVDKDCDEPGCMFDFGPVVLAGMAGVAGGIIGIQLTGDARDGTGSVGYTILGTSVGLAIGLGSQYVVPEKTPGWIRLGMAVAPTLAGGIIGYHSSSDDKPDTQARMFVLGGAF
jgi:hypothetical protein